MPAPVTPAVFQTQEDQVARLSKQTSELATSSLLKHSLDQPHLQEPRRQGL
jgi:hypothetical protein